MRSSQRALCHARRAQGLSRRSTGQTPGGLGRDGPPTGPTGNRYGDPAGHSCIAIAGPPSREVITLRHRQRDRVANMHAFAKRALEELAAALKS